MNINNIPEYFIWFIIYSFLGWAWETLITSIPQRRFVNRGFLNGPYCPIYGAARISHIMGTRINISCTLVGLCTPPFQSKRSHLFGRFFRLWPRSGRGTIFPSKHRKYHSAAVARNVKFYILNHTHRLYC